MHLPSEVGLHHSYSSPTFLLLCSGSPSFVYCPTVSMLNRLETEGEIDRNRKSYE